MMQNSNLSKLFTESSGMVRRNNNI